MQIEATNGQEERAKVLAERMLDHPTYGISVQATEKRRRPKAVLLAALARGLDVLSDELDALLDEPE